MVEGNASCLASSPDGRTFATEDLCGMVQLWDFETPTLLYQSISFDFEVKGFDSGLAIEDLEAYHLDTQDN
ncbi:hypothetical protein B7494_g5753 [Chlorociboria aeruginascens]|nr:hypothetical protein B7494_g5753 [Chlorociboria aeruginascens]